MTLTISNQTELFEVSKQLVPGGVHSPVRSFKGMPMTPRFFKKTWGAYFEDTEGKNYIDFCMSFGPLIAGHRHPQVEAELKAALERGWSYGACEPYSLELAQFLLKQLPFVDQIRFVNSGTEAVMTALRLARGFTGKNKIIKFNGCYHGHVDSMLIKAGSGLAGTATSSSAGVPEGVANDTLILELGDLESVKACFRDHKNQIAAIIIEPLPANSGLLIQDESFLKALREITKENQALLIFDEVISGFRVGFGGMAKKTNITPDIVTYGKIIGGGLPVGALAARKEIMQMLAPVGPVYQAGTLSANPLAMTGGLATLSLMTEEAYKKIEHNTLEIVKLFEKWLATFDGGKYSNMQVIHYSSLFWIAPKGEIKSIGQVPSNLSENFAPMFEELLKRGIYLAPNAWEVGFASLAHDEKVIADLKQRLGV